MSPAEHQRYALGVAAFATILDAAVTIALYGVLSVVLSRDPVGPGAGTLVGPGLVIVALLVLVVTLVVIAVRTPPERWRVSPLAAVAVGAATWLAQAVAFGLAVGGEHGSALGILLGTIERLADPFTIGSAVLGAVVALLYLAVVRSKSGRGTPRWPWEDPDGSPPTEGPPPPDRGPWA